MSAIKAIVKYTFTAASSNEYSVNAGEVVTIVVDEGEYAFCTGARGDGYIPKALLQIQDNYNNDDNFNGYDNDSESPFEGMVRIHDRNVADEIKMMVANPNLRKVGPIEKKDHVKTQAEGASNELLALMNKFKKNNVSSLSPDPIRESPPVAVTPRRVSEPSPFIRPVEKKSDPKPEPLVITSQQQFQKPMRPNFRNMPKSKTTSENKQKADDDLEKERRKLEEERKRLFEAKQRLQEERRKEEEQLRLEQERAEKERRKIEEERRKIEEERRRIEEERKEAERRRAEVERKREEERKQRELMEQQRRQREEIEKRQREEAERKRREETERRQREIEKKQREEAERKRREEAERKRREEVERKRREEDENRQREIEKKQREEAERRQREEAERRQREIEKKQRELIEQQRRRNEEAERKQRELMEQQRKEAERKQREEGERRRLEQQRLQKQQKEAERKQRELMEQQRKAEAEQPVLLQGWSQRVVTLYACEKAHPRMLAFARGEYLLINPAKSLDEWYYARNVNRQEGYVPKNRCKITTL